MGSMTDWSGAGADPGGPDVAAIRKDYTLAGLAEADLAPGPVAQFARWFAEAQAAVVPEPTAMTLATAGANGQPAARVVLLKGFDKRGFVFYSNYESAKGEDLAANPRAALSFFWPQLERQIRIEGDVERVSREESKAYFDSRPLGSRLGATLSRQSAVVSGRAELEAAFAELQARYGDGADVPLPENWGGYRVRPRSVEFWQGRPSRLHDRLRYRRDAGGDGDHWTVERLAP
jgi:pyridoxamine 5'-phosphate oxidase